jgi:hypothetical protein
VSCQPCYVVAMRAVALVLMFSLTGCNFAVKHPSTTAGIVVGSLGFATCSLTTSIGEGDTSFTESGRAKCYGVTAGAAIGIGLLTALAIWFGYEDEDAPVAPGTTGGTIEDPANLEPAPVFVPKPLPKPEPTPEPTPPAEPPPAEPSPVNPAPVP